MLSVIVYRDIFTKRAQRVSLQVKSTLKECPLNRFIPLVICFSFLISNQQQHSPPGISSSFSLLPFLLIRDEQYGGKHRHGKHCLRDWFLSLSFPLLHLSFCFDVSFLSLLVPLLSLKFALFSLAKSSRIKVLMRWRRGEGKKDVITWQMTAVVILLKKDLRLRTRYSSILLQQLQENCILLSSLNYCVSHFFPS